MIKKTKDIKRPIKLKGIVLIGVCSVLAISSIFLTIETVGGSMEIVNLEKKGAELSEEKRDLESLLVKTLSTRELQEKSTDLGFSKPADLVYINKVDPVANAR